MNVPASFEELAEELLGGGLVPPPLHQDVQDIPLLIHGPPEIMALPIEREEDFIQMPLVASPGPSMPEPIRIGLAEFAAPLADGLIGHDNPTGEQEFFHIAVAQAEAEVQPDTMADDLGWKAMVLVLISRWWAHEASIAYQAGTGQAAQ
jgi:hypothetical protein